MKTKRDGFLAEFQDQNKKILETASRLHYGFKEKSSTQPGARFTITPTANIKARISSAKRRGFMTARPSSTQRGTEPGMKDPLKAKLNRLAKKSSKIKHSYRVPHMADLETAETKPNRLPPKPSLEATERQELARQQKIEEENRKLDMKERRTSRPRILPPRLKGENDAAYRERIELTNLRNMGKIAVGSKDLTSAELKDFVARAREAPKTAMGIPTTPPEPAYDKAETMEEFAKMAGMDYPKARRGTFALREGPYGQAVAERDRARETRGALGILDWLAAGGVGPQTQEYLSNLEADETGKQRFKDEQREAYRQGVELPKTRRETRFAPGQFSGVLMSEINERSDLSREQKIFLEKLLANAKNKDTFNLREFLHKAYEDELASGRKGIVSSFLKKPAVTPFAEVWKQTPHTKVWDEERMRQHAQEQQEQSNIDILKGARQGVSRKPSLATQLQMESRPKRRPGATSRTEMEDFETEPAEMTEDVPGGRVTEDDLALAEMRGMPSALLRSRGNIEGNQIWNMIRTAMQYPEVKARVAEDLAYEDRTGKISNRNKLYFLEALSYLQNKEFPRQMQLTEQERDDIVEHIDNTFLQHQASIVNNPGRYLDASTQQFPTNMRQYLTLVRSSLPDMVEPQAVNFAKQVLSSGKDKKPVDTRAASNYLFSSRSKLQAMIEAFREIERQKYALSAKVYASKLQGASAKDRTKLVKQYEGISNQAQQMGKKIFSDPDIVTMLRMAYRPDLGNITEKYQHAAVPRTKLTPTPGYIGQEGQQENTIINSIKEAMTGMENVPVSRTAGRKGAKAIKQESIGKYLPLVRTLYKADQPISDAFKRYLNGTIPPGDIPMLKSIVNLERLNDLKRYSGQLDLLKSMIKTGKDPAGNELPLATLQQKARDYKQLVSARDALAAQLPEAALKKMYEKLGFPPEEVARYVQEIFPFPSLRGKAEEEKLFPVRGVTPPSAKERFRLLHEESEGKQAAATENLDTYIDRLNKGEESTYHAHLLKKDYEERLPKIIAGLVPTLVDDSVHELQRYGVIDAADAPYVYRTTNNKLALKAPDMATPIELPDMPSFNTARYLTQYEKTNPVALEKRIYELKKAAKGKQDPAAEEAEIHALEFLRLFYGPMMNIQDMSKFQKGPLTGKLYGPDKPLMMRDLDDPEKNLYTYTPEEMQALQMNYKASQDLLGMGIGNLAMLKQYGKMLDLGPNAMKQLSKLVTPFYSMWWTFNKEVPKEEMPTQTDSNLPYAQRIENMLSATPRGVALPPEEVARRELEAEVEPEEIVERGKPIEPSGKGEVEDPGWADIQSELRNYIPSAPEEEVAVPQVRIAPRQTIISAAPETPAPEFKKARSAQTTLSGGAISDLMQQMNYARSAVQKARTQPKTVSPWEGQRKLMGRKRGLQQAYYKEHDPASMAKPPPAAPPEMPSAVMPAASPTLGQMKARTAEAKVPGQQTFEGQDACDKFMRKYAMETAEKGGFSVAGRPTGGRTITGEKRMAKFYGQGGDGSGERKSAVLGIKHVTPQSTIKQTWKSKNVTQNKPKYQMAQRIKELTVNSPTERNNKPDLGMNISVKPGPFEGQKVDSIKDKMDIRPKRLEIDGGMTDV